MKRLAKLVSTVESYEELKELLPRFKETFEQVEKEGKENSLWKRIKDEYSNMSVDELADDLKLLNIEDL